MRVNNKKLEEEMTKIEDDQASDQRVLKTQANISSNIHMLRNMFYSQLFVFGTLFFASTPMAVYICKNFVQESNQQMFHTMFTIMFQIMVYFYLLFMLTNKSSKYHSATFRS